MSVLFLNRPSKPALAYQTVPSQNSALPMLVFLGGFCSDMEGTKAAFLAQSCAARGQGFVRFDYTAHGVSEGVFEDCHIGTWMQDALDVIDTLTTGPLVLAGSSMGGWIGILCAKARPLRVKGFIGLAAAPDFTRDIPSEMNTDQHAQMKRDGYFFLPNDYGRKGYKITKEFLAKSDEFCIMDAPISISCPVRLIQGMKDMDVAWQTAHRLSNNIAGDDKKVYLREEGDHRLSTPEDLALLEQLVVELSGA